MSFFCRVRFLLIMMIVFTKDVSGAQTDGNFSLESDTNFINPALYTEPTLISSDWTQLYGDNFGKPHRLISRAQNGYFGYEIKATNFSYGDRDFDGKKYTIFKNSSGTTTTDGLGVIYEIQFGFGPAATPMFTPWLPVLDSHDGNPQTGQTSGSYSSYVDVNVRAKLVAVPLMVSKPLSISYPLAETTPFQAWETDTNRKVGAVNTFTMVLRNTTVTIPSCSLSKNNNIDFGNVIPSDIFRQDGIESGVTDVTLDCSQSPNLKPVYKIAAKSAVVPTTTSSIYPDGRSDPDTADVIMTLINAGTNEVVNFSDQYSWLQISTAPTYLASFKARLDALPNVKSIQPGNITGKYEIQVVYQ